MRKLFSALLLLAPSLAFAAVTLTDSTDVTLLRGSTTVGKFVGWDACLAEAKRLANASTATTGTVTYTCQTERRQVVAVYSANPPPPPPPPPVGAPAVTFDPYYQPTFRLTALSNEVPQIMPKPAKATSLSAASLIDPAYLTRVYRLTDHTLDVPGSARLRHDYSRRQAFNADSSLILVMASNGSWHLFNADTGARVPGKSTNTPGALSGLAGDAEAFWHPTDKNVLWYNRGLKFFAKDVRTDTDTLLVDFTGRLPWPQATQVWTKAEGVPSADGRYWALMATNYNSSTQQNEIFGIICWDRVTDTFTALPASAFGGAWPDHVSMSPSGQYVVPSWAYTPTLGTRAYPRDFSTYRILDPACEHSDLAIGPNGEDMLVIADYATGYIRAVTLSTGAAFNITSLYPAPASGYAVHISGKAYRRPGWVVLSTYADSSSYGAVTPGTPQAPQYRKIMVAELKPGGRILNVAHTRTGARYGGYFGEPQASANPDLTRIAFVTNFDDGTDEVDTYIVGLPSWAIP